MRIRDPYNLLWSFYVPSLLFSSAYSMMIPVLPVYAGRLTVSLALIGMMLSAESVGRMLGDLPAGLFLRRLGMRGSATIGMGLAGFSLLLLIFVNSIWLAAGLLFVSGFGIAFYNISRHAYIATVVPVAERGRAIALFGGVYRLGKFAGPILGGQIAGLYGLRSTFVLYAVLAAVGLVFVWLYMRDTHRDIDPNAKDGDHSMTGLWPALMANSGVLAAAGIGQILAQLTRTGWQVIIPLYGERVLGLDVTAIGWVVGIGGAFDVLFFYFSGVLMDRFGRKWAIVPSFVLQGSALLLMPLAGGFLALTAVSAFIGFANGLSSGSMMTLGSDLAPVGLRGEFLSVWRLIGDAGFVGGPLVVGVVAQVLALPVAAVVLGLIGLATGGMFTFFVPETLQRQAAPVSGGD